MVQATLLQVYYKEIILVGDTNKKYNATQGIMQKYNE